MIIAVALLRYALPGVWHILAVLFTGTLFFTGLLFFLVLIAVGFFTYRNLKRNKMRAETEKYARVSRTEALYRSVISRLQNESVLNQVSADELLQSEVLITDRLRQIKEDLIRLKEFTSPKNEKFLSQQMRDYQQQIKETSDESIKQLIRQNMSIVSEKQARFAQAREEIREKEGLTDLVYNTLQNVDEDLKFARTVRQLFPAELYSRFGLTPPSSSQELPPLIEKSSRPQE